jgi:hypothetical protein
MVFITHHQLDASTTGTLRITAPTTFIARIAEAIVVHPCGDWAVGAEASTVVHTDEGAVRTRLMLPPVARCRGERLVVIDGGGLAHRWPIHVHARPTETVDGKGQVTIKRAYASIHLLSDGRQWLVTNRFKGRRAAT